MWWKKKSSGLRANKKARTLSVRLRLEPLEGRLMLAAYLWTGADGANPNGNYWWSNANNWLVGGVVPAVPPGGSDDVTFNASGNTVSGVDLAFGGTVRSITI